MVKLCPFSLHSWPHCTPNTSEASPDHPRSPGHTTGSGKNQHSYNLPTRLTLTECVGASKALPVLILLDFTTTYSCFNRSPKHPAGDKDKEVFRVTGWPGKPGTTEPLG